MDNSQGAPGLLASTLLSAAKLQAKNVLPPVSSGCAVIDEQALNGGFRHGEIISIAGASSSGKTTFAFHTIASHLLQNPTSEVAIIDTKGTFSPQHLRDILAFRLRALSRQQGHRQSGYMYESQGPASNLSDAEASEKATSMLDRVKVMRVFDFAGLAEAIGEVAEVCESVIEGANGHGVRRRTSVADSEDEADEGDAIDDGQRSPPDDATTHVGSISMIVIDTIANVVSSVMAKSQVQGQALLSSLMRSLRHLTSRHQLCILLTNSMVSTQPSSTHQRRYRPEDDVSIFTSVTGKPALGKSFAHLIDRSILLSSLPASKADARSAYGSDRPDPKFSSLGIFEVLKDRNSRQAENWVAFNIESGKNIRAIELQP